MVPTQYPKLAHRDATKFSQIMSTGTVQHLPNRSQLTDVLSYSYGAFRTVMAHPVLSSVQRSSAHRSDGAGVAGAVGRTRPQHFAQRPVLPGPPPDCEILSQLCGQLTAELSAPDWHVYIVSPCVIRAALLIIWSDAAD